MGRTGRHTIVGLNTATTWNTAVNLAANTGILPFTISPSILQGEPQPDLSIGNWTDIQQMDLLQHLADPTILLPLRRTGALYRVIAQVHGDDTKTGADPYTHTFNWQDESTLFSTLGVEINGTDIIEWPSLKFTGYTLRSSADGYCELEARTIGDTINIAGDATNTGTQFDAVTYISSGLIVPWRELRLRLNAQGGGALGSGDVIKVSSFELSVDRPYERQDVSRGASTGIEFTTDEPILSGDNISDIKLSFTVNDYTTIALLDDLHDETEYKADLYFAKTVTTAYSLLFALGRLHPMPADFSLDRQTRPPFTRNFRAMKPTATPTGMATANIIHSVLVDGFNGTTYE